MARWWRRGGSAPISQPAPPAGESAPAPAAPTPAPVQRAEWRDLPPLQPVVTAISTVAPPDSFARTLATWHNPSFLGSLGHTVDPSGPAGQVDGLAVPVGPRALAPDAELPVAARVPVPSPTVQRAAGPWQGFAASFPPADADGPPAEPLLGNEFVTARRDDARTLSVAPRAADSGPLTIAPDLTLRSTLPAVPRPAAANAGHGVDPGAPTVSRSLADDGHPDDGDAHLVAPADLNPLSPGELADQNVRNRDDNRVPAAVADAVVGKPPTGGSEFAPL